MGSLAGHKRRASASLTMTTRGVSALSVAEKSRPRTSGSRIVSKYFGETLATITGTGDIVDSDTTSAPSVSPLNGRLLASAADVAPGRDDARSTRSARSASRRDGV